jgi:glycosyltransferase involved in cell wall biosynthesis
MNKASTQNTRYQATVVITTKNRKDDLRTALKSVVAQVPPVELLVIDDGSTDGTVNMVTREFPEAIVHRYEKSLGLIVQRNNAADLAKTNIIFSLDDDAEFSSPHVVAQTVREFDDPRVGAVSIPFIDTYRKISYGFNFPDKDGIFIDQIFIGTSHALRVDVFRALAGYREFLYHQGEEDDYCIRLLNSGYYVRRGRADHICHHVSPSRNSSKIAYYGARNAILYTWANVPMPYFPVHLLGTSFMNLRGSMRNGIILPTLKGLLSGLYDAVSGPIQRGPVSIRAYKLSRRIRKQGLMHIKQAEEQLYPGGR